MPSSIPSAMMIFCALRAIAAPIIIGPRVSTAQYITILLVRVRALSTRQIRLKATSIRTINSRAVMISMMVPGRVRLLTLLQEGVQVGFDLLPAAGMKLSKINDCSLPEN